MCVNDSKGTCYSAQQYDSLMCLLIIMEGTEEEDMSGFDTHTVLLSGRITVGFDLFHEIC